MRFLTYINLPALVHLVVKRMIFLLFPSVRKLASVLKRTSFIICCNEILSYPISTLFFFIVKDMRFSPEVLPVVSIHTELPWELCVTIGAPHSFEMKHIKVSIFHKFVTIKKIYCDLIFRMSEGAHGTVVAAI